MIFCDFWKIETNTYSEVKEQETLIHTIKESLKDYNLQNKKQMDLVIFQYAAEHICRINRILKQPYGNALLVN